MGEKGWHKKTDVKFHFQENKNLSKPTTKASRIWAIG